MNPSLVFGVKPSTTLPGIQSWFNIEIGLRQDRDAAL